MGRKPALSPSQTALVKNAPRSISVRSLAKEFGVSPATIQRILGRVRTADEIAPPVTSPFTGRLIAAPRRVRGASSWSIERIRAARDALLGGDFADAAAMSVMMGTDDAIFVPRQNRIDALNAIGVQLVAHDSSRGKNIARKCEKSVSVPRSVISMTHFSMFEFGVGFGFIEREVVDGGTRIDFSLSHWPNEFTKYDPQDRCYKAITEDGTRVPITHGDGNWVIFRKSRDLPHRTDGALAAACLIWAAHAEGLKSWAMSADSHGLAKIVGELPEGVSLQQRAGEAGIELTPEANEYLQMLIDLASGDIGAGIQPAGAKTDFIANPSAAWQVFSELIGNREKGAARVYLGTDAILGSVGGAPGVDIAALFGVASTKLQGDISAIEQALVTGVYEPWTALNAGDTSLAPRLRYQIPDPDAAKKSSEQAEKRERLVTVVERLRSQQFVVTQDDVNELCAELGIDNPPQLAPAETATVPLALAPTDVAKVVLGREARAAQGLPAFGDYRDNLTLTEIDEDAKAKAAAKTAALEPQA